MAYEDLESKECLCGWLASLGDLKQTLLSFITGVQAILVAVRAYYATLPTDLSDEWEKLLLQADLEWQQQKLSGIMTAFGLIAPYTAAWADCPPVGNFADDIKKFRDEMISGVQDKEYEIQQKLAAYDDHQKKSETINKWIESLDTLQAAIEYCDEQ